MNKKVRGVIAVFMIIIGFGMIHSGNMLRENIGSGLIGVGTLYFLVILYLSSRKDNTKTQK